MTTKACYLGKVPLQPLLGSPSPSSPCSSCLPGPQILLFSVDEDVLVQHERAEEADVMV